MSIHSIDSPWLNFVPFVPDGKTKMTQLIKTADDVRGDSRQPYLGFGSLSALMEDTGMVFLAALDFPQEYLPEDIRDDSGRLVSGNRVFRRLEKLNSRRASASHCEERDRRIAIYAQQVESSGSIEFEKFVDGAVSKGRPKRLF